MEGDAGEEDGDEAFEELDMETFPERARTKTAGKIPGNGPDTSSGLCYTMRLLNAVKAGTPTALRDGQGGRPYSTTSVPGTRV